MSVVDKISRSLSYDVQSKPWLAFNRDNPGIAPKVVAYLNGGARPTDAELGGNKYALARVYEEDARREAGGPPSAGLPFLEASLRSGYETLRGSGDFGSSSQAVNGGEDCLIDLEGVTRVGSTTVWTKDGQRVHVKHGRWNFGNAKGGLRLRAMDGIGAEHVSATDMMARNAIDAFVVGGNPGSPATTYTLQKVRTEYPSVNFHDGGEHVDAVQVQGDLKRLEIGMSTFWLAGVLTGGGSSGHPGKGLMLNTISKIAFAVELNRVNYRAADLLTGAAIFKDYAAISMETTEVYFDKQGTTGNQWGTGGAFFPTAQFAGDVASWAPQHNWQGVVKRGLPPGGDFCP